MKLKNGYTAVELVVLLTVMGIVSLIFISKTSYAFKANNDVSINQEAIIKDQAIKYANSIKEEFQDENTKVILVQTLIDNNFLIASEDGKYVSAKDENIYLNEDKIEISYNQDTDEFIVVYPKQ